MAAETVAAASGPSLHAVGRDLVAGMLAIGLGMQNSVVRRLAVPDLTTTVLTMTVTGIAADAFGKPTVRRLLSLACIFAGALCGGLLVLHQSIGAALGLALALLVATAALARME